MTRSASRLRSTARAPPAGTAAARAEPMISEPKASISRLSSPAAWKSIRDVIERLDVMPMQVHIEAQVVEVQLSGALKYGVNWYFERAVTDAGLPSAVGRSTWSTLAGSITEPTASVSAGT